MTTPAPTPVLILGGAQSDFARSWSGAADALPALLAETLKAALEDAAIDDAELRALNADRRLGAFVGNFNAPCFLGQGHLGALLTEANNALAGVTAAPN